jgi:hypothetical protein
MSWVSNEATSDFAEKLAEVSWRSMRSMKRAQAGAGRGAVEK